MRDDRTGNKGQLSKGDVSRADPDPSNSDSGGLAVNNHWPDGTLRRSTNEAEGLDLRFAGAIRFERASATTERTFGGVAPVDYLDSKPRLKMCLPPRSLFDDSFAGYSSGFNDWKSAGAKEGYELGTPDQLREWTRQLEGRMSKGAISQEEHKLLETLKQDHFLTSSFDVYSYSGEARDYLKVSAENMYRASTRPFFVRAAPAERESLKGEMVVGAQGLEWFLPVESVGKSRHELEQLAKNRGYEVATRIQAMAFLHAVSANENVWLRDKRRQTCEAQAVSSILKTSGIRDETGTLSIESNGIVVKTDREASSDARVLFVRPYPVYQGGGVALSELCSSSQLQKFRLELEHGTFESYPREIGSREVAIVFKGVDRFPRGLERKAKELAMELSGEIGRMKGRTSKWYSIAEGILSGTPLPEATAAGDVSVVITPGLRIDPNLKEKEIINLIEEFCQGSLSWRGKDTAVSLLPVEADFIYLVAAFQKALFGFREADRALAGNYDQSQEFFRASRGGELGCVYRDSVTKELHLVCIAEGDSGVPKKSWIVETPYYSAGASKATSARNRGGSTGSWEDHWVEKLPALCVRGNNSLQVVKPINPPLVKVRINGTD